MIMHGLLALYLIACLNPANHNTCVSLPVTDSTQAQPDGAEMSMMECMGVVGANSAERYWDISSVDGPAKSEIRRRRIGVTLEADHA